MYIEEATDPQAWDAFLTAQRYRPFLQSWTMGEVYKDIGEEPIRIVAREGEEIIGICQAIDVQARRGRHLAVLYGPLVADEWKVESGKWKVFGDILETLKQYARERGCVFIRISPFIPISQSSELPSTKLRTGSAQSWFVSSPLHVLAEHLWYLPLKNPDPWKLEAGNSLRRSSGQAPLEARTEEEIFSNMRATTRNLIRRAEKEGVTVRASEDPVRDIAHFLALHEETRKRHGFTPYTESFFRAQVARFALRKEVSLYLAEYQGKIIASSIHMHTGGETSYHHGASSFAFRKIPASTLLQWTAIRDALRRGDHIYNFWGVAPVREESGKWIVESERHPFAGVTLFKTGFGGKLLPLMHCRDIPLSKQYAVTWGIEMLRKWKRGF